MLMITNYLRIAVRTLLHNKGYSIINILGLVVGISFSCMLYVYVSHELSYDTFHAKSDRIFRVLTIDQSDPQNTRNYGLTAPPFGPEVESNYPEVEQTVRLHRFVGQVVLEHNGENFQERNWYTTDHNFFDVFDFEFVSGDKATALKEPHSLVLTETMAKKYFGDKDPVGEVIEKTAFGPVKITGVIKDLPDNSHLNFDLLFSRVTSEESWNQYLNNWDEFGAYTYVVLHDANAIQSLRSKMPKLIDDWFAKYDGDLRIDFQAIEDIYLHSGDIEAGTASAKGQLSYVYIFSSMGIFLLLIACINYINLSTSKAMMRSREVGVRKVVGAGRGQLIAQFLMESFILTILSAFAAIFLMDLVFPYFNQITGKSFDITFANLATYALPLFAIAVVIGMISGSYPAFYLATLKPVSSLRGREVSATGAIGLRRVLVVFQFVITIVMIVSTMVIGRQMNFIQTKDVGFDKDRLMVIDINNGNVRSQFRTMKHEYSNIPGVQHVAVSTRVPGEWKNIPEKYVSSPASPGGATDSVQSYYMGFDEDMLATYRMTLQSGRYFSNSDGDSTNILLNESAVKALGLSDPLGATVTVRQGDGDIHTTVIGVIKDFNFQSLHQKIAPIVIGAWNNPYHYIDYFTLKITGDTEDVIAAATKVHEKFDQRTPIEYHFLDEQLESYYVAEKRAGMIFRMGGFLSVFVACLGLFGLATYNIQRRTKELGIRKVLGASGLNLFVLLSSTVAKQIGLAFLIATPLAWYVMKEWLAVFEYRISLHAGIFLLAGLLALVIALGTVSYRTLKAVKVNPVNSLRQE
jgi:putative ABC transport system permease protein